MSSSTNRRGRPKGSGIDDRALLRRIDDMLEADPALKPTTAIKAIGVTDPSTIRRLRDKLKTGDYRAPCPPPARAAGGPAQVPQQLPLFTAGAAARAVPDRSRSREFASAVAEVSAASGPEDPARWFLGLYALGLSAFSSTVEAQLSLMGDFFHVPQVESALRHQLLVNDVAKAFCPKRPGVRTTLH